MHLFDIIIPILIVVIILVIIFSCLCIVPQGNAWVIERLGKYQATWEPGLHLRIPVIERIARKISMKEQVADFEPQSVRGFT